MKVLNKLILRNFFMNKKRTIVTIIGIMLSTALITAVANMAESFRESMINYEKIKSGNYHYAFYNVKAENLKYFENNRNIKSCAYISGLGYSKLEGSVNEDKPYLYLCAADEAGMKAAGINLVAGRLPQNDSELVISKHIQTNGGVSYKLGDKLSLDIDERISDGEKLTQNNPYIYDEEELVYGYSAEYTVVGIMERMGSHIEEWSAPGYTVMTLLTDKNRSESFNVYAVYTKSALKNRDKVTASVLGVSEETYRKYNSGQLSVEDMRQLEAVADYHTCNIWLLKWELMNFSDSTKTMMYSMAGVAILIIIFTSIFCIRNSFVISLTEKMKLYGMMSSVGATKKQRRRLVRGEAFLLGCIGIPLGIACGTLATYIVVKCTSNLMLTALDIELVYKFSVPAMISGIILSAVTVYFSAGNAARKAAKVSPIVAIRGNETVKVRANELHTPKLFSRLFGIGGVIAYKSLRRARVKYRTTIISIVVSVSVFIAMTTFTQLGFRAQSIYYEAVPYQIRLSLSSDYKDVLWVTQLEDVNRWVMLRNGEIMVKASEIPFDSHYLKHVQSILESYNEIGFNVISIGDSEYSDYCRKLGLSLDKVKDKGILIADYMNFENNGKRTIGMKYRYKPGDIISGTSLKEHYDENETSADNSSEKESNIQIEIAAQTDIRPMGLENWSKTSVDGIIVVSDEWMDSHQRFALPYRYYSILLKSDNPDELQKTIKSKITEKNYTLIDENKEYERNISFLIFVSVFLYGFITVISLIGITNIFNTITTNMELRQREFAMLKSIGMTKKEFRHMIWLENIFYGIKSLLIGVPVGIALSALFYKAFANAIELPYELPYGGILISVIAVFILLFVTAQYSMNKINRKNIVETIQNENI